MVLDWNVARMDFLEILPEIVHHVYVVMVHGKYPIEVIYSLPLGERLTEYDFSVQWQGGRLKIEACVGNAFLEVGETWVDFRGTTFHVCLGKEEAEEFLRRSLSF